MILIVVRQAGWRKSPWDSYTKEFEDEAQFLKWWTELPDDSYTKSVSREYDRVKVYRVEPELTLITPLRIPSSEGTGQ